MRTTIEIEDELMEALLARHPDLSKRQAVEAAISAYLERGAAARIRALAGRIEIEDLSAELRSRDRRT